METFYDGDLKDIWDSDLDPTETLRISNDHDIQDWFMERDVKDPTVILNDKLISDALLNGTIPIKSEHSYSLNSDGDSLPNSPQTKMDDMDDECYPAISLKTATSIDTNATIDPKCLTLHPPKSALNCTSAAVTTLGITRTTNALLSATAAISNNNTTSLPATTTPTIGLHPTSIFGRLSNGVMPTTQLNLRTLEQHQQQQQLHQQQQQQHNNHNSHHHHQQQQQQRSTISMELQSYLPQKLSSIYDNDCSSSSSTRDGSISPDICSDIEIDESCIKDEPMSPDSSCPASPKSHNSCEIGTNTNMLSLNMATIAAYNNTDLVYDHKNGCLQLSTQSLIKSQQQQQQQQQQLILSGAQQNISLPKITIKSENKNLNLNSNLNGNGNSQSLLTTVNNLTTTPLKNNANAVYGIPLTPPSSLPSDESEGNLTPEHLFSPLSPTTSVSISVATTSATATAAGAATAGTIGANGNGEIHTRRTSNGSGNVAANGGATTNGGRNTNAASTRQPIHTPLISSQPKGSTGTLLLTEEEKRTLLAEGYPIPQKLPLTKAEEKSLKKIRRKIKNKISAQESRRKKKEYMDQLERRVEVLVNENNDFKKRVESLEDANSTLLSQLHKLQALVNKHNIKKT